MPRPTCVWRSEGGHLYRRGSFAFLSEAGAVTSPEPVQAYRKGQVEEITVKIAAVDKRTTGYQLAITLPDKATEASLKDFYGSVLNGGAVNDQKDFDFGNETDGWYYAGSSWMYGAALAAGTPAPGRLRRVPTMRRGPSADTWRNHAARWTTRAEPFRLQPGRPMGGRQPAHDPRHARLPAAQRRPGISCVRTCPPWSGCWPISSSGATTRACSSSTGVGAHWYYDAIITSGVNGYYNAFFYKAARDLAEMEEAAGRADKAREYRGAGRVDQDGVQRGAVEGERPGRAALPGLDRRPGQGGSLLLRSVPMAGRSPWASLRPSRPARSWPRPTPGSRSWKRNTAIRATPACRPCGRCPTQLNPSGWQTFGTYMNGGSLLCQTYWEIVARARAGDHEGAARRLGLFAQRAPRRAGRATTRPTFTASAAISRAASPIWPTWWSSPPPRSTACWASLPPGSAWK